MSAPVIDANDELLDYAQGQLKAFAVHQVEKGFDKIDDPKVFLATLKDMSQTAIARKRVKVEEQVADNDEQISMGIAQILRDKALRLIYTVEPNATPRSAPALGDEHQALIQNPGVKDIGPPLVEMKQFMAETQHLIEPDDDD